MPTPVRKGYSSLQIGLHWAVAVLVAVQFLFHDAIEDAWEAFSEGDAVPADAAAGANIHALVGVTILVLALSRLYLRLTRGVPAQPQDEPKPLRLLAQGTHIVLYVLIIGMPLGGAAAWFFGIAPAARVHGLGATVLFWLVVLHILGGLFQQFVMRSSVLTRMAIPEK